MVTLKRFVWLIRESIAKPWEKRVIETLTPLRGEHGRPLKGCYSGEATLRMASGR